jgi:hypothetical protein
MRLGRKNKRGDTRKAGQSRLGRAGENGKRRARRPVAAIIVGVFFVVATSLVIIASARVIPWQPGQSPTQDIRSRATFAELDEQATEQARKAAQDATANYFTLNMGFIEQVDRDLTELYSSLAQTGDYQTLSEEVRKRLKDVWGIDETNCAALKEQASAIPADQFRARIDNLRKRMIASDIVSQIPEEYQQARGVLLVDPLNNARPKSDQWTLAQNREVVANRVEAWATIFRPFNSVIATYLTDHFQPVWLFDRIETDRQRLLSFESDQNKRYRRYALGLTLVKQNQPLSEREIRLLELENRAYWELLGIRWKILTCVGIIAMVSLITLVAGIYCSKFQFRAIHNWSRAFALAAVLFAMISLSLILHIAGWNDYLSVFTVVLVGAVLTIAYDQRFALMMILILTCLLLLALSSEVSLLFALLAGGITVVFTLDEVRRRSKMIEVAAAVALMSFAVVWAIQLANHQQLAYILANAAAAGGSAFFAGMVVQITLPVIERLFQIATSMTLLEWCDASKPLLRRLALEAPGTFNHSLLIGSMAENAAGVIGANGLLARVGAYHHDIGKLTKREYYVENQPNIEMTRHKGLSPAMSLLIIIGHVKDGLELAREYGLPKVLHQFIAEHHGTTLVEYFYHRASQQKTEAGEQPVSDVEFRYPGPKPRSKESGILMLADAVEGATRALSEPTVGKIEGTVHLIVKRKLEDGQLDECELTLRELHQIEESLTRSLWAIYHGRMKYPSQEKEAS